MAAACYILYKCLSTLHAATNASYQCPCLTDSHCTASQDYFQLSPVDISHNQTTYLNEHVLHPSLPNTTIHNTFRLIVIVHIERTTSSLLATNCSLGGEFTDCHQVYQYKAVESRTTDNNRAVGLSFQPVITLEAPRR